MSQSGQVKPKAATSDVIDDEEGDIPRWEKTIILLTNPSTQPTLMQ